MFPQKQPSPQSTVPSPCGDLDRVFQSIILETLAYLACCNSPRGQTQVVSLFIAAKFAREANSSRATATLRSAHAASHFLLGLSPVSTSLQVISTSTASYRTHGNHAWFVTVSEAAAQQLNEATNYSQRLAILSRACCMWFPISCVFLHCAGGR